MRPGEVRRGDDGELYACIGYGWRGPVVMRFVVIDYPTRPPVEQPRREAEA